MPTSPRSRALRWLSGATLVLLIACVGTTETGTGSGGSTTGPGAGGTGGASPTRGTGGRGSATSSSSASSSSTGSGAGASPLNAKLVLDVTQSQIDAVDVAIDGSGNIVVAAGGTPGSLPPPAFEGTQLTRYSPAGQVLWQKLFMPMSPVNPPFDFIPSALLLSIAVDAAGDVYASGQVQGLVDLGGVIVDSGTPEQEAGFLFKLDPSGNLLWHKVFTETCLRPRVSASPSGGVLLSCSGGPVDLGGGLLQGPIFVASYDPDGTYRWGRGLGDSANGTGVIVQGLAPMPSGDWVMTGYFGGNFDFGGGFVLDGDVDGGSYGHLFVARLAGSSGAAVWARRFGDDASLAWTGSDSVAVDAQGDVILGGDFSASVDFGGGPLVNPEAATPDTDDGFVAKLAGSDGSYVWSLAAGGTGGQLVTGVAITGSGGVQIAGSYANELTLGGQTYGALGAGAMFLATLSSATPPQVLTVSTFGSSTPSPGSIASGPGGVVAVGGSFTGTVDFGPPVGSFTAPNLAEAFVVVMVP